MDSYSFVNVSMHDFKVGYMVIIALDFVNNLQTKALTFFVSLLS